ncbi:unnamed protein product, partial [Meganyctiphanes norvegica]
MLSFLGGPTNTSLEYVTETVEKVKVKLSNDESHEANTDISNISLGERVSEKVQEILSIEIQHLLTDKRIEAGCFSIVLLGEIPKILEAKRLEAKSTKESNESCYSKDAKSSSKREKVPPAPPDLLSVQQTNVSSRIIEVRVYLKALDFLDHFSLIVVDVLMEEVRLVFRFLLWPKAFSLPLSFKKERFLGSICDTICVQGMAEWCVSLVEPVLPKATAISLFFSNLSLCLIPIDLVSFPALEILKWWESILDPAADATATIPYVVPARAFRILMSVRTSKNWEVICGSILKTHAVETFRMVCVIDAAFTLFISLQTPLCSAILQLVSECIICFSWAFYSLFSAILLARIGSVLAAIPLILMRIDLHLADFASSLFTIFDVRGRISQWLSKSRHDTGCLYKQVALWGSLTDEPRKNTNVFGRVLVQIKLSCNLIIRALKNDSIVCKSGPVFPIMILYKVIISSSMKKLYKYSGSILYLSIPIADEEVEEMLYICFL